MIKKIFLLGAVALMFAACGDENNTDVDTPNDTTVISETTAPLLNLTDFDAKAGEFVGKEVEVSGIVDHVCKHGGKKLLLVEGDNNMHVYSDERFDEALSGSEISVVGIVEEERVDSAFLAEKLKHEEESHGDDSNEADVEQLAKMKEHIKHMMDSLKSEGVEYFSNYSLKYVSHTEKK